MVGPTTQLLIDDLIKIDDFDTRHQMSINNQFQTDRLENEDNLTGSVALTAPETKKQYELISKGDLEEDSFIIAQEKNLSHSREENRPDEPQKLTSKESFRAHQSFSQQYALPDATVPAPI